MTLATKKHMARQLEAMTPRVIIGNGIIADSPSVYSQHKNTISPPAEPQKSPMIVGLSHRYVLPPHSRARRNMVAVGAKRTNPNRSSDSRVERKEGLADVFSMWLGIRMKKRKSATKAPAGRLM